MDSILRGNTSISDILKDPVFPYKDQPEKVRSMVWGFIDKGKLILTDDRNLEIKDPYPYAVKERNDLYLRKLKVEESIYHLNVALKVNMSNDTISDMSVSMVENDINSMFRELSRIRKILDDYWAG